MINSICGKRQLRAACGQHLIEGIVALSMIVLGIVLMCLFVVHLSLYLFAKQKMALCADQTAAFGALQLSAISWEHCHYNKGGVSRADVESAVQGYGRNMITTMGLSNDTDVEIKYGSTPDSAEICTVIMRSRNVKLFGNMFDFPGTLPMQEKAVSIVPNDQPPAVVFLCPVSDKSKCVVIPCYGLYNGSRVDGPSWTKPYKSHFFGLRCPVVYQPGQGPPTKMGAVENLR